LPSRGAGAVRNHTLGEVILVYELRRAGACLGQLLAESAHIYGRQRRRRCRAARKDARQQEQSGSLAGRSGTSWLDCVQLKVDRGRAGNRRGFFLEPNIQLR
jgi:hypothetical protein